MGICPSQDPALQPGTVVAPPKLFYVRRAENRSAIYWIRYREFGEGEVVMKRRLRSGVVHLVFRAIGLPIILTVLVVGGYGQVVMFTDSFTVPGTKLDTTKWTTERGPGSYLGRTQLADWITPGGIGQFVVDSAGAQLALNTFNPTGSSMYGTHAKTLASFQPALESTIVLSVRLRLTSLQPGLVYGIYFYGCRDQAVCATRHDEIDIELVTNLLQPGVPRAVQLNTYADEPLGAGNGQLVNLPAGFDPIAVHEWTIRWSRQKIEYLVDSVLLSSRTTHVPSGPMQANVLAWAPAPDWPAAYSATLQQAASNAQNQRFVATLNSVAVTDLGAHAGIDFNADGKSDILWQLPSTGDLWMWFMNGTAWAGQAQISPPTAWRVPGAADLNGDGKPDILWQHPSTGELWVWFMNGTSWAGQAQVSPATAWRVAGTGDFNGDGKPDILWQHPATGELWVWYMNGATWGGKPSSALPLHGASPARQTSTEMGSPTCCGSIRPPVNCGCGT